MLTQRTQDRVPYRYGVDEIPADITKQELLFYFSFNQEEGKFIHVNSRLFQSRVALGIQLGAYKFIGRPQQKPEIAPSSVIRFVARALKLRGDFVPLKYSERTKTR